MAFEEGAGVLQVLFGLGFGGGEARKRFVEHADDTLLFGEWGEWDFEPGQRFTGEVLDTCTIEMILQSAIEIFRKEVIEKPAISPRFVKSDAMKSFLKVDWFVFFPDSCASGITAFANEHVAFDRCVFLRLRQ